MKIQAISSFKNTSDNNTIASKKPNIFNNTTSNTFTNLPLNLHKNYAMASPNFKGDFNKTNYDKDNKLVIILLGAPASGKGTQAKLISKEYNIGHISTGDLLRAEVKKGSELGKKAESIMKNGGLVPDEIVIKLAANKMMEKDCENGFLLDGFPRTVAQAEALNEELEKLPIKNFKVINLDVAREVLINRVMERAIIEGRSDDTPEILKVRLDNYEKNTKPLIDFDEELS